MAKQIAGSLAGRVRAWCGGYELFLDDFWSGRRVCWRLHQGLVDACFGFGAAACRESGLMARVRKTIVNFLGIQTRRLAALKGFPGSHWEDNFWTIFGLELDGGKAWRSMIFGLEGGLAGGCITTFFERCCTSRYG